MIESKSNLWERMNSSLKNKEENIQEKKSIPSSNLWDRFGYIENDNRFTDLDKEDLIKRILILEYRVEFLQRELDLATIKKT